MPSDENRTVYTAEENGEYIVRIEDADGKTERKAKVGAETEYGMVSLLFDYFCAHTGKMPRWGTLTGIHPIKLLRQLTEQHGEAEAARLFREKYFVETKTATCGAHPAHKSPLRIKAVKKTTLCTIPVPFCPTRCARTARIRFAERGKGQEQDPGISPPAFGRAERDGESRRCFGLNLRAVYVGCGTPTTFSAEQLSEMIRVVKESFDMSQCEELTVDAGRPDTIDRASLDALLKSGVSRISINPQTLQDNVLENIGRRHTAQQTVDAFHLARKRALRISIWISLSACRVTRMRRSVTQSKRSLRLTLKNVTVHALALKRLLVHHAERRDQQGPRRCRACRPHDGLCRKATDRAGA